MPTNLSTAQKIQIITSFIRENYPLSWTDWTDQQSHEILTQAQAHRGTLISLTHHIATENGLITIPITSEAMGALIKINGVDIFGVNSGTTINQTHYGDGDNVAGDKIVK